MAAVEPPGVSTSEAGHTKDVFLSHSSQDSEWANSLCRALELLGVHCWIAPRDVAAGTPYASEILVGVTHCRSLVLLASESALNSVQVRSEVEQAHKRAKPIYTVLLPGAKVRGEMDFYLSRLHWLECGKSAPDEIAKQLATVILGNHPWEEVAPPLTLGRTVRLRPTAFGRMLAASFLSLVLVAAVARFALNRMLYSDFHRWGYVDLAAERGESASEILGHANVWVMANGVRFADVRLKVVTRSKDGRVRQHTISEWPAPEQMGLEEHLAIPLESETQRLATCLVVPNRSKTRQRRVTQEFLLVAGKEGLRVSELAEKVVKDEDGSPCTVSP